MAEPLSKLTDGEKTLLNRAGPVEERTILGGRVRQGENPLIADRAKFQMEDDDAAATRGVAVFIVRQGGATGRLYANVPGAGASKNDSKTQSDAIVVDKNADPATNLGGVAFYFDEDGAEGARFLWNSATQGDIFIATVKGRLLPVKHDTAAATKGVQVYFDDDGATASERFLFVSPTNVDGSEKTSKASAEVSQITT